MTLVHRPHLSSERLHFFPEFPVGLASEPSTPFHRLSFRSQFPTVPKSDSRIIFQTNYWFSIAVPGLIPGLRDVYLRQWVILTRAFPLTGRALGQSPRSRKTGKGDCLSMGSRGLRAWVHIPVLQLAVRPAWACFIL